MGTDGTDDIPDFLIDRLDDLGEEALKDVASYARNPRGFVPDGVPENVADPIYMQSEDVCAAVADHAWSLAERRENTEPDDEPEDPVDGNGTADAVADDDSGETEDPGEFDDGETEDPGEFDDGETDDLGEFDDEDGDQIGWR